MYRISDTVIPYDDIDYEIRDLCKALNEIVGVETVESCVGHGEYPCFIAFKVERIEDLSKLLFYCFNHEHKWKIYADVGDPHRDWKDLHFILQSDCIKDTYLVELMVQNLTSRIRRCIFEYSELTTDNCEKTSVTKESYQIVFGRCSAISSITYSPSGSSPLMMRVDDGK